VKDGIFQGVNLILYSAPRGTTDILPEEQSYWRYIEQKAAHICQLYGYKRIDPPVLEDSRVFIKGNYGHRPERDVYL
jgi:histidyl-tRNA synthetase